MGCRAERGLVNRNDGSRSGRAGSERGCIRDTAQIRRGLIGDRYALQSKRVIFLPDHTRPSHKNWSALVGSWSAVWCECSFRQITQNKTNRDIENSNMT